MENIKISHTKGSVLDSLKQITKTEKDTDKKLNDDIRLFSITNPNEYIPNYEEKIIPFEPFENMTFLGLLQEANKSSAIRGSHNEHKKFIDMILDHETTIKDLRTFLRSNYIQITC